MFTKYNFNSPLYTFLQIKHIYSYEHLTSESVFKDNEYMLIVQEIEINLDNYIIHERAF